MPLPLFQHKKRAVNLGFISKLASPFPLVLYLYLNNIIYGFVSVRYGIRKDILLEGKYGIRKVK